MRFAVALTACAGMAVAMLTAPAVLANAANLGAVPVMMNLSSVQGSGTVQVELETAKDPDAFGVPQELDDSPVTTVAVTGGGIKKVSIPVTSAVLAQAADGLATFEFFVWFGSSEATSTETLPVTSTAISEDGATGDVGSGGPQVAALSPFGSMGEAVPAIVSPLCVWYASGSPVEESNRIGQMQDSTGSGSQVSWTYNTEADSSFGVGVSGSLTTNFMGDGSYTVSNSIGSSGGFPENAGFNKFVDGHFYRQRYESDLNILGKPACGHLYKAEYRTAVGDSYPGPNAPAKDPYGRCGSDPNGLAEMAAHGGFYNADRGHATNYSGAANIFDIAVNGQTGYTSDIHVDYTSNSSLTEYVCGNAELPDAPILWSNNSSGV